MTQYFVVFFWLTAASIASAAASAVLGLLAFLFTLGRGPRKALIIWSLATPWILVAIAAVVSTGIAIVNVTFLHRDAGLGENFTCPLPNGYQLSAIDKLDHMTLEARGRSLTGIQKLQLQDPLMLGALDSRAEGVYEQDKIDGYFLIQTATGEVTNFKTEAELADAAKSAGVSLKLEKAADIYLRNRPSAADHTGAAVVWIATIAAVGLWIRGILRVRGRRT